MDNQTTTSDEIMSEIDYNELSNTCVVCGSEQGQSLEDFENSKDFELTDDCGRTIEVDSPIVICEDCFEASHDTHWHATHPEFS